MKMLMALFMLLFVTIPSLIYSVSNWVITIVFFPLALLHQFLTPKPSGMLREGDTPREYLDRASRGGRQRMAIGSIIFKYVTPLLLVIVVPYIFYVIGWYLATWVFSGWMILYFVIRRWSSVSQGDIQKGM